MRVRRKLVGLLLCVMCLSLSLQGTGSASKLTANEGGMLEPSELFKDFPQIKWGMSFRDVKQAIEKTGAHPVRPLKDAETELVWLGTFDGIRGRASARFTEGAGLTEVVVGVFPEGRQGEVFAAWLKKLVERQGAAQEEEDNSVAVSKVWRLKNRFAVELRSVKDDESPIVDVHWVKE
ncbi:MAG TPA: hypothetical protein VGV59_06115 [Pyrinomonadaceae bacterium]|nr:hypothetical protein [Pyrinomonadaceae bacterium]